MRVTPAPQTAARHAGLLLAVLVLLTGVTPRAGAQAPPQGSPQDAPPALQPDAPAPPHPIWGTWKFTLDDGICAETYHFRRDGTSVVTSGAEVTESSYEISARPSARGYYRLDDRVTHDNGKPDCTGTVIKAGHEATTYVRLHPSGSMIIFCASESPDSCIGPLYRIPDEEM